MLNPLSFRPGPVVFWTTAVYLALLIPLVIINESVPSPRGETSVGGLDLTEAWLDLAALTQGYHPYNSRKNEEVRSWLLSRLREILDQNGVSWTSEVSGEPPDQRPWTSGAAAATGAAAQVTVFDDLASNYSTRMPSGRLGTKPHATSPGGSAAYFEGTNVVVYIRGTDDPDGRWWEADAGPDGRGAGDNGGALALINAHYDSVSTGFGATDDGMGVVSVLQVVKHFTSPGRQPRRGIVALLNNGEEDFLYGARAFGQSPLLPFVHTFLNLEGAGAGGRALLFRTTDQEVTAAYARTSRPFGTVIGSDFFSLGLIRSQTDFVVFDGAFGQRGLDLAFFKPRQRYHTNQDDARHASRSSLWHMLSAAVHTMENLSGDTGDAFVGPRRDGDRRKVQNGRPSDGVWFDLFGRAFVLFNLRAMFAWSLTLLIATPLILSLVAYLLSRADKHYFFTVKARPADMPDCEPVPTGGLRGLFRFPLALTFAGALALGAAFLLRKINPLIIYSSQYSVHAMILSLFYFAFWLIMRGASFVRPSALHRGYVHLWLFLLSWAVLVAVTVSEDRAGISSGYVFVFFHSAVFLSALVTLAELFALPKRAAWARQAQDPRQGWDGPSDARGSEHDPIAPTPGEASPTPGEASPTPGEASPTPGEASPTAPGGDDGEEAEVASETTPLVGRRSSAENIRTTFATTYRRSISAIAGGAPAEGTPASDHVGDRAPYDGEQPWSGNLPSWTWLLQFLIVGPFIIVLAAQIGLTFTDALHQTGTDGSSALLPYILVVFSTAMLVLPLTPFIHRVPHQLPVFLLAVFAATLAYNLAAFPFSANNRFKLSVKQSIELGSGETTNHYYGLEEYLRLVIGALPSSAGRDVSCEPLAERGIAHCSYDGSATPPDVGGGPLGGAPPQAGYAGLVSVNVTRGDGNKARLEIDAVNTKACFVRFEKPVSSFSVAGGSGWDARFGPYPDDGVGLLKLWRRDRGKAWLVDVAWTDSGEGEAAGRAPGLPGEGGDGGDGGASRPADELKTRSSSGLEGSVSCQWSDANARGTIPFLDEALQYAPVWAGVTKNAEGLVEGTKGFAI